MERVTMPAGQLRRWRTPQEVAALAQRARRRGILTQTMIYALLTLISLPIVVPYVWLVAAAFTQRVSYGIIPSGFTLNNWRFLWVANLGFVSGTAGRLPNIWQVVANSLVLAVGTAAIVVVVSTLAGYFISRRGVSRRAGFLKGALALQAFPGITLLIPLFLPLPS